MSGPLDGVRIIEIGSAISGPFAAKLLGDMGAEVVKIESPAGGTADRTRDLPYDDHGHGSFTWRFLNYNSSKESLALDLKADEGEVFLRLVEAADVCLENMRPGSMERLGLGWETLRAENPELIYCSIKGYGRTGPYRDLPALDTLMQGISGFATQVGEGSRPRTMRILIIDMLTGLYAAWSIAMALFERATSGEGQRIDVSMLDAAVSMLGHQLAEYSGARQTPSYEARYDQQFAPRGFFRAADGYLGLFILDDHWTGFCDALGTPEWASEGHPYSTNASRVDERAALRDDLEALLGERPVDDWMTRFGQHPTTIPAAPVNDIEAMIDDPQIRAQESVVERDHPALGSYLMPNVVPKFSRTPGEPTEAPALGSATERVLEELGFTEAERRALYDRGVID